MSEPERQRIEDYAVRLLKEIGVWVQCDRAREQMRQILDNPPPPDPKYDEDTLQELRKIVERADKEFGG